MPRLSRSVPSYRKHRATGQAVVTLNGRDHYLGPHGTKASRIAYDRLIAEWLASGRSPSYGVPDVDLSIAGMLVEYLRYAKKYYGDGPRTEFANMRHAVRPLKELYSREAAQDFGPLELKAVRERFVEAGHCRSYINDSVRRIVRVFRWSAAEGLIPASIPQALGMVPGLRRGHSEAPEGRKVMPVAPELVNSTLPHLNPILRAMVELQWLTGMRPGELVIMRPGDVNRSGEVWEYRPTRHKTEHVDKNRTIWIGPKGQDVLRPFLLRPAVAYCFSPIEAVREHRAARSANRRTPLSCGNRPGTNRARMPKRQPHDRYTPMSFCRAIQRGCERAFPVPAVILADPIASAQWVRENRWTPNQLRHSAATEIRRMFGLEAAQVTLGHSRADVTQVYAERDQALARRVAATVG